MNLFKFREFQKPSRVVACLALLYFVQAGAYVLSIEEYTLAPLISLKGLELIFYSLLLSLLLTFVTLQGLTMALWTAARCFHGEASIQKTRNAALWTMVCSAPLGFFWLFFFQAYQHREFLGKISVLIGTISFLGIFATIVFMLYSLYKSVADVYQLGRWKTIATLMIALTLCYALLFAVSIIAR